MMMMMMMMLKLMWMLILMWMMLMLLGMWYPLGSHRAHGPDGASTVVCEKKYHRSVSLPREPPLEPPCTMLA